MSKETKVEFDRIHGRHIYLEQFAHPPLSMLYAESVAAPKRIQYYSALPHHDPCPFAIDLQFGRSSVWLDQDLRKHRGIDARPHRWDAPPPQRRDTWPIFKDTRFQDEVQEDTESEVSDWEVKADIAEVRRMGLIEAAQELELAKRAVKRGLQWARHLREGDMSNAELNASDDIDDNGKKVIQVMANDSIE